MNESGVMHDDKTTNDQHDDGEEQKDNSLVDVSQLTNNDLLNDSIVPILKETPVIPVLKENKSALINRFELLADNKPTKKFL